jgi:hypothetical protein
MTARRRAARNRKVVVPEVFRDTAKIVATLRAIAQGNFDDNEIKPTKGRQHEKNANPLAGGSDLAGNGRRKGRGKV